MTCTFYYVKCRCKHQIPRCKAAQPSRAITGDVEVCLSDNDWHECPVYLKRIEELERYI